MQDLDGELRVLEEKQGLELGALKSNSFHGHTTREGMLYACNVLLSGSQAQTLSPKYRPLLPSAPI